MNLATRAALYNAFLFPGWGHFYLKQYKRGIMIILPFLAGIASLCWTVVQVAVNISKAHPLRKGTVDITAIISLSMDATKAIDINNISLILSFIILLWIISIIDAYQLGKKQIENITTSADQQSASPQAQ
jgi:TM2 domain-containing membrane protein YozV